MSKENVFFIFVLSNTLKCGRVAGVGYSDVSKGRTLHVSIPADL